MYSTGDMTRFGLFGTLSIASGVVILLTAFIFFSVHGALNGGVWRHPADVIQLWLTIGAREITHAVTTTLTFHAAVAQEDNFRFSQSYWLRERDNNTTHKRHIYVLLLGRSYTSGHAWLPLVRALNASRHQDENIAIMYPPLTPHEHADPWIVVDTLLSRRDVGEFRRDAVELDAHMCVIGESVAGRTALYMRPFLHKSHVITITLATPVYGTLWPVPMRSHPGYVDEMEHNGMYSKAMLGGLSKFHREAGDSVVSRYQFHTARYDLNVIPYTSSYDTLVVNATRWIHKTTNIAFIEKVAYDAAGDCLDFVRAN